MLKRFYSSVVAAIIFGLFILIGGIPLRIAIAVLAMVGMIEFKRAIGSEYGIDTVLSAIIVSVMFNVSMNISLSLVLVYIIITFIINIYFPKLSISISFANIAAFVYVSIPFLMIYRTMAFSSFDNLFLLIFFVPWSSDIAAYFTGSYLGSKKLFERISPNKTLEGAIGGLLAAVAVSVTIKYLFISGITIFDSIVIGLFGGVLAQYGDLIASMIKRNFNVSDYGSILPGHGGIMDRFDSVIVVGTFIYLYFGIA